MLSKIEISLILVILFFSLKHIPIAMQYQDNVVRDDLKSIEMHQIRFVEVNQTNVLDEIRASRMVEYPYKVLFYDITLRTADMLVKADKATSQGTIMRLEEDIHIKRSNGSRLFADLVSYDRRQRTLLFSHFFDLNDSYGNIHGDRVEYDLNRKILSGKAIHARYEME